MAEGFPISEPGKQPSEMLIRPGVIRRRGKTNKPEEQAVISATDLYTAWLRRNDPKGFEGIQEKFSGSGHLFEAQILGRPPFEEINKEAINQRIVLVHPEKKYVYVRGIRIGPNRVFVPDEDALNKCFELVKKNQGGDDPENPKRELPRNLRLALIKKLGISKDENYRVKYYSSVGTMLDHTPGVNADAFFEINGTNMTIDITMRDSKEEWESRADVVIARTDLIAIDNLVAPGSEYSKEHQLARASFLEQIDKIAESLILKLIHKQKEKR